MKFAVLGDPVSHSLSPKMHTAAYRALGLNHTYEAIQVAAGQVATTLDRLRHEGYAGVNVTVPLKEEALQACTPDPFAQRCGAVNTLDLRTGMGINTDGPGMVEALGALIPCDVLLLGAGGSARALVVALQDAGCRVTIWNRTASRAASLAAETGAQVTETIPEHDYDVAINTTSASMSGESLTLAYQSNKTYIDLYYSDHDTPFVEAARAVGATAMDGRELLVAQGALAFEFWLGGPAPRSAMKAAVGL